MTGPGGWTFVRYLRKIPRRNPQFSATFHKVHSNQQPVIRKPRHKMRHAGETTHRYLFSFLFILSAILCCTAYPSPEDMRYIDRDPAGAHQLASWLAYQMRPKEFSAPLVAVDSPIIPYRLPLQGKRNSEVTNAIIGSEETQKMYRDGR